jgi:hypothetical protein
MALYDQFALSALCSINKRLDMMSSKEDVPVPGNQKLSTIHKWSSPWPELVTRSISNLACKFKIWVLLAEGTKGRSVANVTSFSLLFVFWKGLQYSVLTCAISRKPSANKVLDTTEAYLSIPRSWFWKLCCCWMEINTVRSQQHLSCKQQAPYIQALPRW